MKPVYGKTKLLPGMLLLTAMMWALGAFSSAEEPGSSAGDAAEASDNAQAQTPEALVRPLAGILRMREQAAVKNDIEKYSPRLSGNVREIEYEGGDRLTFSAESGQLLQFSPGSLEEVPRGLGHDKAISRETALEHAKAFLAVTGRPCEEPGDEVGYQDLGDLEGDDLQGARWVITRKYRYQGIKCYGKGCFIAVSAYSGRVESFIDFPVVVPDSLVQKVSAEEATAAAQDFVDKQLQERPLGERLSTELGIVQANDWWSGKPQHEPKGPARLCWVVVFKNTADEGDWRQTLVYVDCETGKVVGGAR